MNMEEKTTNKIKIWLAMYKGSIFGMGLSLLMNLDYTNVFFQMQPRRLHFKIGVYRVQDFITMIFNEMPTYRSLLPSKIAAPYDMSSHILYIILGVSIHIIIGIILWLIFEIIKKLNVVLAVVFLIIALLWFFFPWPGIGKGYL